MIILFAFSLASLGLVMLYSAGRAQNQAAEMLLLKQAVWLGLSVAAFLSILLIDLEKLRRYIWFMVVPALMLLGIVLIPSVGLEVNGARRWLSLGYMNMQVADFAKIAWVFTLAHYLGAIQRERLTFWRGFMGPLAMTGGVTCLVLLQPDYGTAFLYALVAGIMLFMAGVPLKYLIPAALGAIAVFSYAVWQDPVRLERVTAFLDVEGNRDGGAYQLWQGILGFGVGGWDGIGLGQSRQPLAYLPEAHTDFIFPVIGEELGFVFTTSVVLCFAAMTALVLLRLQRAPGLFHFLLVLGCLLLIVLQALFNFGVSTGCLPTKGVSLPLISYGGSNLLATFILLGIICNELLRWNRSPLKTARELTG